jgi:ectoine hydroxylase-related dioxygenase (phytanoyl-CoA dioxygenase family)
MKFAFYLDPLTPETGALRIVPGSHHAGDAFATELQSGLRDPLEHLGVQPCDIPAVALSTKPGDVVAFDHRIKHASFGGGPARRMFAMNFFARCDTERTRELTARLFRMYGTQGMEYFFTANVTDGAPVERMRRLEPALQFEPARDEGYAEYLARVAEPSATS